ncbi:hypothetical protein C4569_02615 [Candidatus Parcubacteria bacterium]|nr:MAG: hypothetical protein C4569_02615 [Candidatus Parcubacteria bacterium]
MKKVTIEVSARHCHISKKDLVLLFGKNYRLKPLKPLSQKGQFSCRETVRVKTGSGQLKNIRILGPERENTQVELSRTDCRELNIFPPITECTDPHNKKSCSILEIIGPKGKIKRCAAIIAKRHLHCDVKTAKMLKLQNKQLISLRIDSDRPLTFHEVLVRVRRDFVFRIHLDTDEANAAGVKSGDTGRLLI